MIIKPEDIIHGTGPSSRNRSSSSNTIIMTECGSIMDKNVLVWGDGTRTRGVTCREKGEEETGEDVGEGDILYVDNKEEEKEVDAVENYVDNDKDVISLITPTLPATASSSTSATGTGTATVTTFVFGTTSATAIPLYPTHVPGMDKKTFPWILHEMLELADQVGYEKIVSWLPDGKSFKVFYPKKFVQNIMPNYFLEQSKYKSFQRQLNLWGFVRLPTGPGKGGYSHPYFVHENRIALHKIQRRIRKVNGKFVSLDKKIVHKYRIPSKRR